MRLLRPAGRNLYEKTAPKGGISSKANGAHCRNVRRQKPFRRMVDRQATPERVERSFPGSKPGVITDIRRGHKNDARCMIVRRALVYFMYLLPDFFSGLAHQPTIKAMTAQTQ